MIEVLIHPTSFSPLIPAERIRIVTSDAEDFRFAYRVISGIYARRKCWKIVFHGDENARVRSVWERASMIRRAHHVLREGGLVVLGDVSFMCFCPTHLRHIEEFVNQRFAYLSLKYQGNFVLSLEFQQ